MEMEIGMAGLLSRLMEKIKTTQTSPESCTYECDICHDQEMIAYKDEDGRLVARECSCAAAKRSRRLLQKSGLAEFVDKQNFDSFVQETPLQRSLYECGMKYVDDLEASLRQDGPKPWLYIGGNPGSGKTHICTAVCGELIKRGVDVKYMQWVTESRKLKFSGNDGDFESQVEEYKEPTVLYIDDLLKQKFSQTPQFTEADIKVAFAVLNGRYYTNKATIISTEWGLASQLMAADEGIFSRVYERCKGHIRIVDRKRSNNFRLRE